MWSLKPYPYLDLGDTSEWNERSQLGNFWVWSNSEFVRILGLFVFFRFGLLFLRSEPSQQSLLGNFWVCSNSGFVRVFWIWFPVFRRPFFGRFFSTGSFFRILSFWRAFFWVSFFRGFFYRGFFSWWPFSGIQINAFIYLYIVSCCDLFLFISLYIKTLNLH